MNKFALQAQSHWQKYLPARYAALEDPSGFFEELGEQIKAQANATYDALVNQVPKDLPYLEQMAQFRSLQVQSEREAMQELVFHETPEATMLDELVDLVSDLPTKESMYDRIDRLRAMSEADGLDQPDQESQAEIDRLQALIRIAPEISTLPELDEPEQLTLLMQLREIKTATE